MLNATKKWLSLKFSSVIMVPFMMWFLIKFVSIYNRNYENIVEFFSSPLSAIIFSNNEKIKSRLYSSFV